jgi:hypothetical protein
VALYTRAIFAAFDAQDVTALAAFMTDDVRSRLGNADVVEGKQDAAGPSCSPPSPALLRREGA